MKIAYAFRRAAFHPFKDQGYGNELPSRSVLPSYLKAVRQGGFEAIEVGSASAPGSEEDVRELRRILEGEGVPAAVIRGGGGFTHPKTAAANRARAEDALRRAAWIGAPVVNMAIAMPARDPHAPGARAYGEQSPQNASRSAAEAEFALTATHLRELAGLAADLGVEIAVEMHQHSLADNSWSSLHLLELVDRPNVGINPDLGNLYWQYEVPEETTEACILALAPKSKYWHCKQLLRLHIPELHKAYFLKVPLPDGEIDYRFAITTMVEAGYQGYLAIEGCREGDQLYRDGRSVQYCREILRSLGQ